MDEIRGLRLELIDDRDCLGQTQVNGMGTIAKRVENEHVETLQEIHR
jgi:hypothetical protein